jgi:hypothetical protein
VDQTPKTTTIMNTEDRIRIAAHSKVRVVITRRKRSAKGFEIESWDGTKSRIPSKSAALQFLLAKVRCTPERFFYLRPAR